jgi:hypothetical protein
MNSLEENYKQVSIEKSKAVMESDGACLEYSLARREAKRMHAAWDDAKDSAYDADQKAKRAKAEFDDASVALGATDANNELLQATVHALTYEAAAFDAVCYDALVDSWMADDEVIEAEDEYVAARTVLKNVNEKYERVSRAYLSHKALQADMKYKMANFLSIDRTQDIKFAHLDIFSFLYPNPRIAL